MNEQRGIDSKELDPASSQPGYYGVPVIHGAHWMWLVIAYFFFGGISGASAVIGAFARLTGGAPGASLARIATYVSFLALVPCPPLLILDLGRPARFLNMLRTFRASSPMSVGTWGLTAFGIISALTTLLQLVEDAASRSRRHPCGSHRTAWQVLSILSASSGFFVAGYTGVLLAATAVPLWSKRPGLLGPLFLSSAMTSGAAAIATAATVSGSEHSIADDALKTLETISAVTEGALLVVWIVALGPTAKPVTEGHLALIVRHGVVGAGLALPLVISAVSERLPRRMRKPATFISSALTLAGVFALRYAVVAGGKQSADDSRATFELTG